MLLLLLQFPSIEEVLIKILAVFFLCPSKQFSPISFQIQLLEYFPQKQKEQRHKQLGYTDKVVTKKILKLKILGPLSNFKIQQ
jgi:hypothetical protein